MKYHSFKKKNYTISLINIVQNLKCPMNKTHVCNYFLFNDTNVSLEKRKISLWNGNRATVKKKYIKNTLAQILVDNPATWTPESFNQGWWIEVGVPIPREINHFSRPKKRCQLPTQRYETERNKLFLGFDLFTTMTTVQLRLTYP